MDDSRHTPRISLAEASLSEMMAELQVHESKYGRSERSKSRDVRRSFEDSSHEDVEDRSTDDDQSGSHYADPYHSDEHDRHVAAANDSERRTEAIGTYGRSENRGRHGDFPNRGHDRNSRHQGPDRQPSLQRRFKLGNPPTETGLVPIGLPQLASPPVDADCVYAFVGESKWLKTQRREEVNEVNTMTIEKERNGSFGGGESNERRNNEWNGGSSEGLVSSVTQKTWHDHQPENVIKLLSGERLGWWSAQKFDKRVRMRALVQGAVNDARTRILLDTGANVSVISERFAKQLRMREVRDHGRCMDVQGFTKGTMATTKWALAKVTLGWNQVYEYELWAMNHGAGWILSANVATSDQRNTRVVGLEDERIDTEGSGVSTRTSMAGTGDEHLGPLNHVPGASTSLAVGSQREPTEDGRVEGEIYQRWLAAQPSAVERVPYTTPTKILRRPSESSEGSVSDRDDQAECATATTEPSTEMVAEVVHQEEARPKLTAHPDRVSEGSEMAQLKLEGAYLAAATVSEDWGDRDASSASEHPGNDIEFEDYARELAFLPDLTEAASTTLDYTGQHVRHSSLSVGQQDRVVTVLKSHERIMISSGNALPPPAYGVVCDIDVQEGSRFDI
ncbi:unnamed protein product [Phytophthora fragariaefolia]|uniref:Unnamed protein product n=1 Tax=Phytophthora fragariaefolia TaxID=1490495 RepID=A0A9W6X367_9STRA|nr:unnamed protein product [Phytophthora fragariaefolia]